MEFLGPILEIAKFIGTPICEYLKYCRNLDENLKILKRTLGELNSQREDMQLKLNAEHHFGEIPKREVENWLQNVQRINSEINLVEKKANERKYFKRASLRKQVEEKIQEAKEFHQKGSSFNILVVEAPTRGVTLSTTTLVGKTTAKKNLDAIWNYLMGDEVRKIGVCGIGGVGKTTIMKHVNSKLLKDIDKFNHVIWVTVSQQLDLGKLQDDIATTLKKDLSKEKDATKRAEMLSTMLEGSKRYVLILDDLWEAISLEKVGIPEPTRESGCKLIITTRSTEVCRSMGCEVVQVKPLSKDEALSLFLATAGHGVLQVPTLKETVNLVIEQCVGLPLAIVTIASSMKGVDDVDEWKNALNELRKGENEIFGRLKFSYDRLQDQKVQHCFLYCALYPEDFEIPREELMEHWIDEGLIEDLGTRLEMYGRAVLF